MKRRIMVCFLIAFCCFFSLLIHPEELKKDKASIANKPQIPLVQSTQENKNSTDTTISDSDSSQKPDDKTNEKSGEELISPKNFSLNGKNRLVPEMTFSIQVLGNDNKNEIVGIYLHTDKEIKFEKIDQTKIEEFQNLGYMQKLKAYFKQDGAIGTNEIVVCMPKWLPDLKKLVHPKFFTGCFQSPPAFLDIVYYSNVEKKKLAVETFSVEIPDPFWAWIWGIAAIFISIGIAWSILRKKKNGKSKISFFKVPLLLTETPTNRYSLSLTQLMIWTYITIFGLVFVWKMTQSFMEITPQVLMLLGIGGGTAAFTRIQAASRLQDIPYRFQKLLQSEDNPRKPKLADIISTGDGRPNLIKYQLITFTILIACIVFFEIVNNFGFPTLSDGLIALMGISSAVYIGNDLSKNISEQDLKNKFTEIDEYLKGKKDEEIKTLVRSQDQKLIDFKDFIEKYLM